MRRPALALSVAAALLAAADVRAANTPGALDLPPSSVVPAPVDVTPGAPPRTERPADPTGNPLWAIPLSSLTATRERPIFLPSRRAPAPAVAAAPVVVPPPPPPNAEPEQPPLVLVGVIAGDREGFAVFLDQASNNVVRLKTGQDHQGWVLRSVKGRDATLEKNQRSTTLALPVPSINPYGEPAGAPPPPAVFPGSRGGPLPRPPAGVLPPQPRPAAAPPGAPPAAPSPSSLGAPKAPIPGDPRPLEDQL